MMWLLQKKDKDENTGQTESEDRPVKSGDGAAREETPGIMGKECNLMTPLGWVQLKALRIAKNKHLKRTECTHKGFNSPLASSTHTYTLLLFPVPTYWSLLFLLAACSLQKKSTLFVPDSFFFHFSPSCCQGNALDIFRGEPWEARRALVHINNCSSRVSSILLQISPITCPCVHVRLCFLCMLILTAWLLPPQRGALHLNPGKRTNTHYVPAVKSDCFLFRFCFLMLVCVTLESSCHVGE